MVLSPRSFKNCFGLSCLDRGQSLVPEPPAPPRGQDAPPDKADKPDDTPKVVSLDQFRKK